jgi:methanogenic corrinoid protein MtbC1
LSRPAIDADAAPPPPHSHALRDTVEQQIIPRLMRLHGQSGSPAQSRPDERVDEALDEPSGLTLGDGEISAFTDCLLQGYDSAHGYLRALVAAGVPAARLCLDLIAPAARRLGEMWSADACDFTEVTISLGRLQMLLHGLTAALPRRLDLAAIPRQALIVPVPGEQHTLGLSMVRDFFRAAGWDVSGDDPADRAALLRLVRTQHFDLLGFSIGCERHFDLLAVLVTEIRAASMNPQLKVLAGGPLLLQEPALAARLGVDGVADDARQAILLAQQLLKEQGKGR